MAKPKIGLNLYTLRDFCKTLRDLRNTMKKVRDIGYENVQVSGIDPIEPNDVAKALEDTDLNCAATHMTWGRFLNELDDVIDTHRLWKCRHSAISSVPKDYWSGAGVDRFLEELPPVAERLAAAGLTFSMHNHHFDLTPIGDTTFLGAIVDRANPKHLNAELDTCWIQRGGGNPVKWIRKMAGREPLLHVKDFAINFEMQDRTMEIGQGVLDWPEIIEAAEAGGVEYCLVEQDNCNGRDPFESVAMSYRKLKELGCR